MPTDLTITARTAIASLAQASARQEELAARANAILFWLGVSIVTALLLGLIGFVVHRRWFGHQPVTPGDASAVAGFGLHELRQMRERGQITDEQYQRARRRILTAIHGSDHPVHDPEHDQRLSGFDSEASRPRSDPAQDAVTDRPSDPAPPADPQPPGTTRDPEN